MSGSTASDAAQARLANALLRTGRSDPQAFREVYTLTSAKLFGICLRICGERSIAEDVLHDVYLTVWKRASAWQPGRGSPITWLATIARNRAIDWRRAQHRHATVDVDEAVVVIDPAPNPEGAACALHDARHLHSCLEQLDVRQADLIRTAFFSGLTYRELAERNGVPLSTMKSSMRRALIRLRSLLDAGRAGASRD